jgi:uncharacterized pyridoxamine 5'-phosphate oxidase family protein
MSRPIDAIHIIQTRRLLLESLNKLYPTVLQVLSLFRVLIAFDEHYELSLLKKDLTYLREKGYIEFIDEKIAAETAFEKKCVKLTSDGKDIADRIEVDPSLEI